MGVGSRGGDGGGVGRRGGGGSCRILPFLLPEAERRGKEKQVIPRQRA